MINFEDLEKKVTSQKIPSWSIQPFWNGSIPISAFRENQPRDILFASDIGASFYDMYLRMQGIQATNRASDTARRKMEAGNFYEAVVVWVFKRCGILKETQGKIRLLDDPDYLPIYGRFDILSGHDGNWNATRAEFDELFKKLDGDYIATAEVATEIMLSEGVEVTPETIKAFIAGFNAAKITGFDFPFLNITKKISLATIEKLSELFPDGLHDKIYEVKSINSRAFWKGDEMISRAYDHHIKQLSFYQIFREQEKIMPGSFLYIDRDSMCLSELPNVVNMTVVKEVFEWVEKMTYYYRNKIEPPKPECIIFDAAEGKYVFNWLIGWSEYKDLILDGKSEEEIGAEIRSRNKTLREKALLKSAHLGETKHGNKKYKTAIDLINKGVSIDDVFKKTNVSIEMLNHYIDKMQDDVPLEELLTSE